MDLVRELKEVRFELNLRGYDCEAVDAFLAKLRSDVATVQQENDAATERISTLESQLQDGGGGSSETEGTLRRTLVLAQRLADETEADSKKAAADLVDSASAEAKDIRAAAETEASSMREAGKDELAAARDEADQLREETNSEAAKSRAEARQQAAGILEEAEKRGAERVVVIEQAAQEAATTMREPIRTEVDELERVRGQLLSDINALETHLEDQRVRVRTAVEALRVGMSGSIEDLERVADDDELLATQPAPAHSGATGSDVAVAPDIDIIDEVDAAVPAAPTVDDVEEAANAAAVPVATVPIAEVPIADEELSVEDTAAVVDMPLEVDEVVIEEVAVDESVSDAVVEESTGPNTEPIPVIATPAVTEPGEEELVDLAEEPSGIFGTEVGEAADADDAGNVVVLGGAVAGAGAVGVGAVVASSEADETATAEPEIAESEAESDSSSDAGFIDRFSEAIDALPVASD